MVQYLIPLEFSFKKKHEKKFCPQKMHKKFLKKKKEILGKILLSSARNCFQLLLLSLQILGLKKNSTITTVRINLQKLR